MDDLVDACHWVANNPSEYDRTALYDHTPIILAGASAGGWCALVLALHFCRTSRSSEDVRGPKQHSFSTSLRPTALLLLYPMLDLSSQRWCQPVFAGPDPMSEESMQEYLDSATQRITGGEFSLGERFPTSEEEMRTRKRLPLLWAMMQSGKWLDYLTGLEGFATEVLRSGIEATIKNRGSDEPEGRDLAKFFPLDFADFSNVSAAVSTLIIHGTQDLEVPISESERLVKKIEHARNAGMSKGGVELYHVEGAGHVFDLDIDPSEDEVIEASMVGNDQIRPGARYAYVLQNALDRVVRSR